MISTSTFLLILLLLAGERIVELVLSARHRAIALASGAIEVGRSHYAAMAAFHASFFISAAAEGLWLSRPFPALIEGIALGCAVAAQALRYWAIATLGIRWNTKIIVFPDAQPVVSGPYRFLRHPNYLAVIVEMICVPMIYGCWRTAVIFSIGNAIMLSVRIRQEEHALGENYARTMDKRPRFIPRPNFLPR